MTLLSCFEIFKKTPPVSPNQQSSMAPQQKIEVEIKDEADEADRFSTELIEPLPLAYRWEMRAADGVQHTFLDPRGQMRNSVPKGTQ